MKVSDYLLLRTPVTRMGPGPKRELPDPGKVPPLRVALSFAGIIIGIVASFYVTGLKPSSPPADAAPSAQVAKDQANAPASEPPAKPQIAADPSRPFWKVFVISLVICALTYPGLYFTLHLYANQTLFLIFLVSFQYGYFWQSAVEGGRALLK